jgi:hypothetical protein
MSFSHYCSQNILRFFFVFLLCFAGKFLLPQAKGENDFVITGSIAVERHMHSATLLATGKVLVAGGYGISGSHTSAELYDPVTGRWSTTGSMANLRNSHTATLLANGKLLVAGGWGENGRLTSAELYDPATGVWSTTGSMANARYAHTANLLTNGKVLVAGGYDNGESGLLTSAELYDPATGLWSATGSMANARQWHTATLLTNGKVLVAGGSSYGPLISAELYDPATGLWSMTGSLVNACYQHTATLLVNGKVLVAGGWGNNGCLTSAELYEPATGLWSATGSMANARYVQTATLLASGKVLVAGGLADNDTSISSAELYAPTTGVWSTTGSMADTRRSHTATLLANSKVLVVGGAQGSHYLTSAELYESDSPSGDYFYSISNGAATITAYRGAGGAVTLPSTIEGFPVTGIDNNTFYGNTTLTSVTIPNCITSIGNQAFSACSGLTSVSLPERFLTDIEYIGLTGQVAAKALVTGIGNNLGSNNSFITDFTSTVLSKSGNYGLATKSDLSTAVASFVSGADSSGFASKSDLVAAEAEISKVIRKVGGAIHIGEDSLITQEVGGMQQLYAQDVNGGPIDINISNGSDLKINGQSVATRNEYQTAIIPLASKSDLSTAISPLASKTDLDALSGNAAFVAALVNNPDFMEALAKQIASDPNNYGISLKQNQTLSFKAIPAQNYKANKRLALVVTSSAKLTPIVYTSSDENVAKVSGKIVTLKGKGSTTITASQAGNSTYNSATSSRVLTVK